jgi:hypothetical protein
MKGLTANNQEFIGSQYRARSAHGVFEFQAFHFLFPSESVSKAL